MVDYPYRMQLAEDPSAPGNVARNAEVTFYDPADTAGTTPLTLTDPSGLPLANPVTTTGDGFIPAFVTQFPEVMWKGAGFTGYISSYVGLRDEAQAAAVSASEAAQSSADAAQAAVDAAALVDAPADEVLANLAGNPDSQFAGQLNSTIAGDIEAASTDPAGPIVTAINEEIAPVQESVKLATSSAFSLPGRRWAFLGDSITNGSSSTNFSYAYASMSVEIAGSLISSSSFIESGVGGQRIAQIAARIEETLDAGAEGLVVMAGTNDSGRTDIPNATPLADYQTEYQKIVDAAKRRGIPVIVCTVPPRRGAAPDYTRPAIAQYNAWLRLWAPGQGCIVAETWGALADPLTGDLQAAYDADGTHPTNAGHAALARVVAAAIREASRPNLGLNFVAAKTSLSISPNPLMAGAGTRPDGFYEQPGGSGTVPTYSLVADAGGFLPAGQWAQMDFDGTVSGGTRILASPATISGTWVTGDRLALTGRVEVEDVSGNWQANNIAGTASITPVVVNQVAANVSSAWARNPGRKRAGTNIFELGPFFKAFTAPANATGFFLFFSVSVPTGSRYKVRFGATDIINLTRLGVAGIEPGVIHVPIT